jgi:3-dehydroquinate dehydratase-2
VRIAVLNGPNLNLLGTREPEIYGRETLADVEATLRDVAAEGGHEIAMFQKNGEGDLVDVIHSLRDGFDAALVNAGAYSHSSLAIRDALTAVRIPFVEVHVSNVYAREPERHRSMLASAAVGVVCGLGVYGYEAGLRGLLRWLRARG